MPKKLTKYKSKVCSMKLGQNFVKYFVRFLGNGVSRKNAFEIYWPLESTDVKKYGICFKRCGLLRNYQLYKHTDTTSLIIWLHCGFFVFFVPFKLDDYQMIFIFFFVPRLKAAKKQRQYPKTPILIIMPTFTIHGCPTTFFWTQAFISLS